MRTIAWALLVGVLISSCTSEGTGPRDPRRQGALNSPSHSPATKPTPRDDALDSRKCNLPKPSRSPGTVLVFLIKPQSGPRRVFVPAERPIGAKGRKAPVRAALRQLTLGTTARERRAGCASYFQSPDPRALRDVALEGDRATIDLNGRSMSMLALGPSEATSRFLGQLTRTVFQFPQINSIRLELDGSCKAFGNAIQSLRCETIRRTEL